MSIVFHYACPGLIQLCTHTAWCFLIAMHGYIPQQAKFGKHTRPLLSAYIWTIYCIYIVHYSKVMIIWQYAINTYYVYRREKERDLEDYHSTFTVQQKKYSTKKIRVIMTTILCLGNSSEYPGTQISWFSPIPVT